MCKNKNKKINTFYSQYLFINTLPAFRKLSNKMKITFLFHIINCNSSICNYAC